MPTRPFHGVLQFLRCLGPAPDAGVADGPLLERFLARHDEAAFALLVARHGKMVLGVCRRLLDDEHAAEDAFQAAFLALACRADSIRRRASVGGWLHRVAYRIALDARSRSARAATVPLPAEDPPAADDPQTAAMDLELRALLDAELNRLPEKYRVPFLRCCGDGE